jgi:hypothetical protein
MGAHSIYTVPLVKTGSITNAYSLKVHTRPLDSDYYFWENKCYWGILVRKYFRELSAICKPPGQILPFTSPAFSSKELMFNIIYSLYFSFSKVKHIQEKPNSRLFLQEINEIFKLVRKSA